MFITNQTRLKWAHIIPENSIVPGAAVLSIARNHTRMRNLATTTTTANGTTGGKNVMPRGLSLGVVVVVAVPVVVLPVADINGVKCTNKRLRDPVIIYYL